MKQSDAVKLIIDRLGGIATLNQINQHIFEIQDCVWQTKTPFASIRRIVRHTPGIYRVRPGLYALEECRNSLEADGIIIETEYNKDTDEIINFNHSYYQGIILSLGNIRGLSTFSPNQDRNKKFIRETLGSIRTLNCIPQFTYPEIVSRSSTIDVSWFNDRKLPHSFFEVEHSTDIQNSLLKFNDLIDFSARMFIVADKSRINEFRKKLSFRAFKELNEPRNRIQFVDYESIVAQYEASMKIKCLSSSI